jgi:hypothetical protein
MNTYTDRRADEYTDRQTCDELAVMTIAYPSCMLGCQDCMWTLAVAHQGCVGGEIACGEEVACAVHRCRGAWLHVTIEQTGGLYGSIWALAACACVVQLCS